MGGLGRDLPSITSRAHLLKQERLDSNLSRLVLTHATHLRTRIHAGHRACTLPCHPLPAYPRSACRVAKVELFNPQHHHPNPKRQSRLNPNPIAGSTGCRLHIHCTATCRQTVITWLVERRSALRDILDQPSFRSPPLPELCPTDGFLSTSTTTGVIARHPIHHTHRPNTARPQTVAQPRSSHPVTHDTISPAKRRSINTETGAPASWCVNRRFSHRFDRVAWSLGRLAGLLASPQSPPRAHPLSRDHNPPKWRRLPSSAPPRPNYRSSSTSTSLPTSSQATGALPPTPGTKSR